MIAPVVVFAVVFAIVMGVYFWLVVWPERKAHGALQERMQPGAPPRQTTDESLLREVDRPGSVPVIDKLLVRQQALVAPLQRLVEQSGLRITVGTVVLATAAAALGGYLIASYLSGLRSAGLVIGAIAGTAPYLWVKRTRDKRVRQLEEYFPEAIDLITRALRAGHAFTTGLAMVAEEMPEPIKSEFRLLYERQNYGSPLPDALRAFAERIPLLDAKFFVTAVLTQREAGGNLSEVLDNLTSVIRDRFTVKRQVQVRSAQGRLTGLILALLPPGLALAFFVMSPEHILRLVRDPLGVRMIIGALALQVIGTLIIRRIVNVEY